jgi:hypothetical protein
MSDDAAKTLLKIYADTTQYNNLIGREVNLRWSDDTGLRNNPGSLSYFGRLFHKGGDSVIDVINSKNLASKVTIIIEKSNFKDCGDKLLFVEIFSICLEILRFDLKNFTEDNNMFIVKEDIFYVYTDYIEFIIDRDRAREGAIYHEISKIFSDLF